MTMVRGLRDYRYGLRICMANGDADMWFVDTNVLVYTNITPAPLHTADETPEVTDRLLALLQVIPARGAQMYDAKLVATMQVYGIQQLLTGNEDDFVRFASVITIVPLGPLSGPNPTATVHP
jgi:predicted nucleic acid-binding protein